MLSFNLLCFVVYIALCDVYVCIAICIHLTSVLTSWRQRSGSQEGWNSVPSFLRRIIVSLPRRARSGCSSGCIMHERALPWYQPYLATRAQHPNLSYRCQWVYLFHQISRLVFSSLVYIFLAQFHKHTLYCLLEANWKKKNYEDEEGLLNSFQCRVQGIIWFFPFIPLIYQTLSCIYY